MTSADDIGQVEERLKQPLVHPTKMFLSTSSLEINGGNAVYEDLGRSYNRLTKALEKSGVDLGWKSPIYDGYTHTSVFAPALNDALIYLLEQSCR